MIRCFIVDDEAASIKVLKQHIKRLPHLVLLGAETNPMKGIALILREKPDLVFLDIHMEQMNGIDVMKIIGEHTKVVFCTAYSEYAVKSYELAAIDYLMKPIEFDRFVKTVHRVSNALQVEGKTAAGASYIYVKWEGRGKFLKIDFNDIDYVQAKSNYVGIYQGTKNILSYQTMKELEERLPDNKFMRIHKSYIVALDKIAQIDNNVLILKNNVQLPIGQNYKDLFLAKMRGRVAGGA